MSTDDGEKKTGPAPLDLPDLPGVHRSTSRLLDQRLHWLFELICGHLDRGELSREMHWGICSLRGLLVGSRERKLSELEVLSGQSLFLVHLHTTKDCRFCRNKSGTVDPYDLKPYRMLTDIDVLVLVVQIEERFQASAVAAE